MTNTSISPEKTVIDPRFDVPEGLDSFVYEETTNPDELVTTPVGDSDVIEIYTGEPSVEETDSDDFTHDAPPTPQEFSILSQTIHMSPDGRQLVDVEIEVEDIPGVIQIDVRVTKT
jgi:hypothetical protein